MCAGESRFNIAFKQKIGVVATKKRRQWDFLRDLFKSDASHKNEIIFETPLEVYCIVMVNNFHF